MVFIFAAQVRLDGAAGPGAGKSVARRIWVIPSSPSDRATIAATMMQVSHLHKARFQSRFYHMVCTETTSVSRSKTNRGARRVVKVPPRQ
jgi:hypothetical protein